MATTPAQKKLEAVKTKLLNALVPAVLGALIGIPLTAVANRLTAQPWHILWFVGPLVVMAIFAWRAVQEKKKLLLRGRLLVFFVIYVLTFSLASSSDLLAWNRNFTVFERKPNVTRQWLAPAVLGDWRYWIVPKKPGPRDLVVVTTPPAADRPLEELRAEVMNLIQMAQNKGARGIAFDFYFSDPSDIDTLLCDVVSRVDMDVIIGFTLEKVHGKICPRETVASIDRCLGPEQRGHLVGLVEPDRVVRLIPLYFQGNQDQPALSLKVARLMAAPDKPTPAVPQSELLRFIEPETPIRVVPYEQLSEEPEIQKWVTGSWVLVGEQSSEETFLTPFGKVPGVLVHAWAIHSLREGHFMSRKPWWYGLLVILVCCYIVFLAAADQESRGRILLVALFLSAIVILTSVVALIFGLVWLDIIYALVAIWLLAILLVCLLRRGAPTAVEESTP